MRMTKEMFLNEINVLDKLLPICYDDRFNYNYAFSVDSYTIDVVEKIRISKRLNSFASFYCNGNKFLVAKEHWLRCQAYNFEVQTYYGRVNTYYIERNYKPEKLTKDALKFLWANLDRF